MKLILAITALLSLGACAQLTGNSAADCLAAKNAALTATNAAAVADVIASHNPTNATMQQGAELAHLASAAAQAQQAATCPAPAP